MKLSLGVGLFAALLLAGTAAARAFDVTIHGTVGPGRSISVTDAAGKPVTHLDPGRTELEVEDLAEDHNFHLTGPGNVDVGTTVDGTGDTKFDVNLVDGTYTFICDVHPLTMKGSFTVGTATTPPPPPTPPATPPPPARPAPTVPVGSTMVLALGVGKPVLRTTGGKVVKRLRPGSYRVSVRDRTTARGVRLTGAGAAKSTTRAFVGSMAWSLRLRAGTLKVTAIPASGAPTTVTVA